MNTLVSIKKYNGQSVQIEATNGADVLTIICDEKEIVKRLVRIWAKMIWKGLTRYVKNRI